MATPKLQIEQLTVTPPAEIRPGSIVNMRLNFNQMLDKGPYQLSLEPAGLMLNPTIIDSKVKLEDGETCTLEAKMNGFNLQFEVDPNTTLSGATTLRVLLSRSVGLESALESTGVAAESVEALAAEARVNLVSPLAVAPPARAEAIRLPDIITRKSSVPTHYTSNIVLHKLIKDGTNAMRFPEFKRHLDYLLCGETEKGKIPAGFGPNENPNARQYANNLLDRRFLPFTDTEAYRALKVATESFVLLKCASLASIANPNIAGEIRSSTNSSVERIATSIGAIQNLPTDPVGDYQTEYLSEDGFLPYLQLVYQRMGDTRLKDSIFPGYSEAEDNFVAVREGTCIGVLKEKLRSPILIELIWSYWHEQAMQVQTMYAIRNRFQNIGAAGGTDPLAGMEISALRPLNNMLWGYIQDEQHRLTLTRRNYEYEHHYGLSLRGKAVSPIQPADRRSKFLEAFHNLLYLASIYFKEDDDTNRRADSFPVLHALKEVHFLLSEGAHNQFGDLPTTSRIEMLMEQWLLSRPEFREFLPTRDSIAYPEEWMGTVDAMKMVQGWTSTSVMFFNDLARFGEQLLLSVRYDHWSEVTERDEAGNWAKEWRSEIQGYIHAFRIVTGVDLSIEPAGLAAEERRRDPSLLIQQRWDEQRRAGLAKPAMARVTASPTAGVWSQPRRAIEKR